MHDHARLCLRCGENPRGIGSSFCEDCKEAVVSGKQIPNLPPRKLPESPVEPPLKPVTRHSYKPAPPAGVDYRACHFCSPHARDVREDLCDACRALLSDFLVWLGRKPLPDREKV
jgi:hypothetical protein